MRGGLEKLPGLSYAFSPRQSFISAGQDGNSVAMRGLRLFRCMSCGYEARIYGGTSALGAGPLGTMTCYDCRRLVDVPLEGPICRRCGGRHLTPWGRGATQ